MIEPDNVSNKTESIKIESVSNTTSEKLADSLLEKAWINDDSKYVKELISLIEGRKLNGNTFLLTLFVNKILMVRRE
jgi:hypothetical protein